MSFRSGILATGAVIVGFSGTAASAQEAASAEKVTQVEEIVVTATRRTEPLQDVPVSISAFSEEFIRLSGAADVFDFADQVPGLTASRQGGSGNSRYTIRGIGQYDAFQGATTGLYLDETPLQIRTSGFRGAPTPRLFDLERVEVLRGPQGTLFGSSTLGGAVRFVTNAPDPTRTAALFDGSVATTQDGGESFAVNGMFNLPLVTEQLALRVSVSHIDDAGWIDDVRPRTTNIRENLEPGGDPNRIVRDINDTQTTAVRAQLQYTPDATLTLRGSVYHQAGRDGASQPLIDEALGFENRRQVQFQDSFTDDDFFLANVTLTKETELLGGLEIVASSSYIDRRFDQLWDFTPLFGQFGFEFQPPPFDTTPSIFGNRQRETTEQFTQEVRVLSRWDSPLQVLIGGFYDTEEQAGATVLSFQDNLDPTLPDVLQSRQGRFKEREIAVFGELQYQVSETVNVTLGGRYFDFDIDNRQVREASVFDSVDSVIDTSANEDGFIGKANVSWNPTRDLLLYATVSEGFRAGGTNRPISDVLCPLSVRQELGIDLPGQFGSDRTRNYEVGVKSEWFERRLRVNASAYQIDWDEFQQAAVFRCGDLGARQTFIDNVGGVRVRGFELEITARPIAGLQLDAGVGYADAVFREDTLNQPAGDRLADVAPWQAFFAAQYDFAVRQGLDAFARGQVNWVDDRTSLFWGIVPPPAIEGYENVDLRLGLRSDRWEVSLFATNLTDTDQPTLIADNDFGQTLYVSRPRTVGLNVRVPFG